MLKTQKFLTLLVTYSYREENEIMTAKAKIKIIKKSEIKSVENPQKPSKKTKQEAAREMVSTVSNWVNEFQQRKREETKNAFEHFLSSKPQANSV